MKCVICGKEFMPKAPNQITCSEACRTARKRQKCRASWLKREAAKRGEPVTSIGTIKQCVVCGKDFTFTYRRQVCCSKDCQKLRNKKVKQKPAKLFKQVKQAKEQPLR